MPAQNNWDHQVLNIYYAAGTAVRYQNIGDHVNKCQLTECVPRMPPREIAITTPSLCQESGGISELFHASKGREGYRISFISSRERMAIGDFSTFEEMKGGQRFFMPERKAIMYSITR